MSKEQQQEEIDRRFLQVERLSIRENLEEAKSAKKPGRAVFNYMMDQIEAGAANGIIAWSPDRLARNWTDGARLLDLLEAGKIIDLKFVNFHFQNNAYGKFALQMAFSQSKHYSDNLSEVIVRSNESKVRRGWPPNGKRLGYRNTPDGEVEPTEQFALCRRMFDLMLTGTHSLADICAIANEEWGFRTIKTKKQGGGPLTVPTLYRMLTNPHYAGVIPWHGQLHPGQYKPMITVDEFNQVQARLGRKEQQRPQKHFFPFTGLIRCGGCGQMITAEHKVNASGRRYTYYHCSRRMTGPRCRQPAIQAHELEEQIIAFLRRLALPADIEGKLAAGLEAERSRAVALAVARREQTAKALAGIERQLTELTGLRLRELLTDDEFLAERKRLERERTQLATRQLVEDDERFSHAALVLEFSKYAADWFAAASDADKRLIVKTVGSHTVLTDKILSIQAAEPFFEIAKLGDCFAERRRRDDVRIARPLVALLKRLEAWKAEPGYWPQANRIMQAYGKPLSPLGADSSMGSASRVQGSGGTGLRPRGRAARGRSRSSASKALGGQKTKSPPQGQDARLARVKKRN